LHQIRVPGGDRIWPGGANSFGAPDAFDPGRVHQSGDLVAADVQAGAAAVRMLRRAPDIDSDI
jgi:hypothetical protein